MTTTPIATDLLAIRVQLDEMEQKMRAGVHGAEKRLGFSAVCSSFRKLAAAQEALRELSCLVSPMPKVEEPSAQELMEQGYM
jgi:hypothetical protein